MLIVFLCDPSVIIKQYGFFHIGVEIQYYSKPQTAQNEKRGQCQLERIIEFIGFMVIPPDKIENPALQNDEME